MADTGRLTTLLEQYRDRLHTRGEEGHDEDITYLMQVLESPLMKEYLLGSSPKSEAALIQEVTTALESQEHDVHLSPNSKRRRHLARKASLRALKLALTPQSSPSSSPRVVQKANEKRSQRGSSPEFPLVHQMMARGYGNRSGSHESSPSPLTGYNNRSGSHESIPSPRWPREGFESHTYHPDDHNEPQVNSPPEDQIVPQDPSYSIDHIYISPYTGKHEPPVIETSTSPAEPEERDHTQQQMLFNSTNTLIEQTDLLTEQGDGKMMSSSSGGSEIYSEFIRKGLKSEDIKTPEMENSQDEESLQELPLMRPPPTSSVPRDHVALPVLPSYSEALSSQQRVKSYEDLLMDKMGHLNNSPIPATTPPGAPPPYYYPRGGPTTTGLPTQNVPTDHPRGAQHQQQQQQMLTISLVKGPQGLGLSINRKKSARKGEISIYVQDLQPGGLAEREGFHKGDYLVSINKQNLSGIGLPTAVALLQQAKGKVEIVLLRQEGGASVGMETALSPTSLPQIPLPINMPAPVNIQPISTKAKDPPPQVTMPMTVPPTSPKIKDPPVLKSLPPIKHHASPSPPPQLSHQSSLSSLKHSPISPLTPPTTPSSKSSEQSKKQKLVTIDLPNEGRDLGFSLIPDEKGNTRVNSIVPEGTAERDGRLQPGDQLVAINGHSVTRLDLSAVIEVLREGRAMGHTLRLVVARAAMQMADIEQEEEDEEEEEIASDSDSCSDYEDCEVELVKPVGQGLGITINALVNDEKGEDRGIYIGSVNPSGLAGMTGKVFSKDRIIKVNQHSLKSLSNMEAANILRNCGQSVQLGLRRQVKPSRPFKVTVIEEGPGINMSDGMKVSRKYNQTGQEEEESSRGDRRLKGDGLFNGLDSEDKQQTESGDNHHLLKEKWRHRVSINRTIRIAHISRPDPSISLGFMMESIVLNDDTGQPGTGNIRHVIQSIREGGPTEQSNVLMVGDELLEVNGKSLVGVAHDEATQLVQSTSKDVTIVVCRSRIDGDSEIKEETTPAGETPVNSDSNLLITTTSESEDDHRCSSSSALTPSSNPALHSIYLNSTIPGFCRRFERQSWRERHAELTRKLKERFEIRRELYYRNFQERLDELQKVEQEMEERNRRLKEAEEKQKAEVEEKRSSLQSGFDYSSYTSPIGYYSSSVNEMGVAEEPLPTGHRDSMASEDSSAGVLSPVPGSGLWENDVVEVELPRGDDGLGFSILDYADPVSPGDHVILVHSLVPGGTAEMDNRLLKGDKLISVNGVSVINHSLEFTVEQLKSTSEDGLVHITVSHSIPDTPDIDSTPSSFSPDNFTQFLHGSVSEEAEGEEEDSSGSGPEERERKREEHKHQQRKKEISALFKMTKPTEHELDHYLKDLVDWDRFGLHLPKMKQPYIDIIKRDERDVAHQRLALFAKWLKVNPDASWNDVVQALETIGEKSMASYMKENVPMVAASKPQAAVERVTVSKDVVGELDGLHTAFVSITEEVKSEIESAVANDRMSVQRLVSRTREERAYDIPELRSVQTPCSYFEAIYPHYGFLNCHLIIVIAVLLSGPIAKRANEYKKTLEAFKHTTQVIDLRNVLDCYVSNPLSNTILRVTIVLEKAWGKYELWLVEELVKALFGLDNRDECQWFNVKPGSLIVAFLASKHLMMLLFVNSVKKLQFMRLIGVIRLRIWNIFVLNDREDNVFSFENSLIQATVDNDVETVKFLLQHIQVSVNAQTEQMSVGREANIQHVARCMHELNVLGDSFTLYAEQVESALERMVVDGTVTVQSLLTATEADLPPNAKSVKTAADFIRVVRPHYVFPNCHLLVIVASVLSDSIQRHIKFYNDKVKNLKEMMPIEYLQAISFARYFQEVRPQLRITLKLEDVWRTRSMYYVEMLVEKIFSLKHPDECQWFRVIPGSVTVVFLVAKHKMMRLIVDSVKKREFMRLTGVISLQVGNDYAFKKEKNIGYNIKVAIAQAKILHYTEIVDFLLQIEHEPLTRYACRFDDNKNCYVYPDPDSTALMIACCNDNTQLVKLLLDNNADPNIQNKRKFTPLMYAGGNSKIVKMLIDHNADVNLSDIYDETALYWACLLGNLRVVKVLLQDKKLNLELMNKRQKDGRTPLYAASLQGHLEVVKQLLLANADPNIQDGIGGTPLYIASQEGHSQIAAQLLRAQADPNIRAANGAVPLYIASQEAYIQIVDQLLSAKSNPNVQNYDGRTPLYIGSQEGHLKVVASLIQAGADPNIQASDGSTPLFIASQNGHFRIVQKLLQASADPNIQCYNGRTPLHASGQNDHLNTVEQLLKASADPNIQDNDGVTTLLVASFQGNLNVVELLLQAQADPSIKDCREYTPLSIAIDMGFSQIAEKLRKAQADFPDQTTDDCRTQ